MKKVSIFILFIFSIWIISCNSSSKKTEEEIVALETDEVEKSIPEISLFSFEEKNEYPDAILEMYSPLGNQVFRPGKVPFEFNIKNFPFEGGIGGFQLKMILNGSDPVGYNSPIFQRELKEGTYRAVAYLIDSEGLALKSFGNYVDRDFRVGDTRPFPYQAEPYIALNLPNNNQEYQEGEAVTIDFLLLGGEIDLDKLKVRIELNELQYEVEEVNPVRVLNLPKGEYQLSVVLLKQDGRELDGPFSMVRKSIVIR
ncbi:hypothetical protein [Mongoliitalea daihaiensis]|uniref:hypothetical protein n=1 Tax=Mongoliitalea daihaiensis TaxID=2782006 RepID=UPI001F3B0878|nr:hypothetical protein [Mongoliitalea daihaiensis]UJP66453.1 hypothetical protein IPZ59_07595 [Mongoliitalea daihaiensis]